MLSLTDAGKKQWTATISDTIRYDLRLVYEWVRTKRLITNRCFIERNTFHPLYRPNVYVCSVC